MRVLLTGGAGFIGSHLAERLLKDGHELVLVDNLNDFYPSEFKRENLGDVAACGEFRFYLSDICDESSMFQIIDRHRPEAIVHLAAMAGVRPSLKQPLLYERVNVHGTMVLLEAGRQLGVKRFVFASSSSVYGISNRIPFSEEDHLNLPVSPYAATKLAAEKLCFTYSHLYALQVMCLRLFTVYGPRQRPDLAIRKFTEMIDEGRSIPVFGDGSTGRDYTFVDDTVQGIVAALAYDSKYEIFNLGNSYPVDLMTLIRTIETSLGRKALIQWEPEQPGDVPLTCADVSKAQRLLGYRPRTRLADGVQKFVKWYRARKDALVF